jgi:hypothetical protein
VWNRQPSIFAAQHDPLPRRQVDAGLTRHRREEGERVRVLRASDHLLDRTVLDDAPQVHHGDAAAHVLDDGEIVRDEEEGHTGSGLEVGEEVHDLALGRDVERADRLVEHDQLRVEHERARDRDALQLPARELARIPGGCLVGQPHEAEQLAHPLVATGAVVGPVRPHRLGHGLADGRVGVE